MRHSLSIVALLALLVAAPLARADGLRNIKLGEEVPPFTVRTLLGEEVKSSALRGKVVVLVYLSAEQRSSEKALQLTDVVRRELRGEELYILSLTADATRVGYFREQRDRLNIHEFPLGLDVGRQVYGALGLIVLPTTVVIDREGRLARVISSCKSDYEHVLRAYIRHTLGLIDDADLDGLLTTRQFRRDRPEDRIARHRAAARLLGGRGLHSDAENELRAALEINPEDADTLLDLAILCIEQGRLDDAGEVVTVVVSNHPDHRRGKLVTGILLFHRDKLGEAETILREALLLNPDPIRTHYYLGLIAERNGDQAAAILHFKEALARLMKESQ